MQGDFSNSSKLLKQRRNMIETEAFFEALFLFYDVFKVDKSLFMVYNIKIILNFHLDFEVFICTF